MIPTLTLLEINQIINCVHGDPHRVLGMHEIQYDGKNALAVRVFIPQAKRITVIDPNDESFKQEMEKIHIEGFFEAVIEGRDKWFLYKFVIENYEGHVWECYDTYSFAPQITEYDIYLFGEGTHYEIFEKLGAHYKIVNGIEGVSFGVWAPNAERVSVIGDFNCWDGRRGQMRVLARSGIWELFIPGIMPGDKYKFEIRSFSGDVFEKSDPYAYLFEIRPSTSSKVFDIDAYEWGDDKWMDNIKKSKPLNEPMNVYELHLGSWKQNAEGGFLTYTEIADRQIPYVLEMGYTHIELLPISEHPYDGSWGYQITGYFAPTSRYGTPDEFMYFVDKCHQSGIGVILDWVPAHFPKDAHGLARFDGYPLYEHPDPRRGEHFEWGTLIFDYGRKEVKNFLISNALFWLEKYHIDGLRVDAVASMLYLDYDRREGQWLPNQYGGNENVEAMEFVKHLNSIVLERNPHALMIAEESTSWQGVTRPVADGGLGFSLKWNMGWMNDVLGYMEKDPVFRKYHQNNLTFGIVYAYTENFMLVLSHDEVVHGKRSMLDKMPGDLWQKCANLRLLYSFMYGHPGKKLTFMGGEFGQFIEWNEKRELDWFLLEFEHHKLLHQFVKDINTLYKDERALWLSDTKFEGFEWINCSDSNRSIISFMRKTDKPSETLLFVCNFTPTAIEKYRMGVPYSGVYKEILNSDSLKYGGHGMTNDIPLKTEDMRSDGHMQSILLSLPPLGAVVLKRVNEN